MKHASERDILLSVYSDVYKDVYGIRPRGSRIQEASDADIDLAIDHLQKELDKQLAEEKDEVAFIEQEKIENDRMDRMRLTDEEESRMHANDIATAGGDNFAF